MALKRKGNLQRKAGVPKEKKKSCRSSLGKNKVDREESLGGEKNFTYSRTGEVYWVKCEY